MSASTTGASRTSQKGSALALPFCRAPLGSRSSGWLGAREQSFRSCDDDNPRQSGKLQLEDATTECRESIVAPTLVIRGMDRTPGWRPRPRHFFDEIRREHSLNRPVQGTGAHPNLPFGHRLDLLRDGVAVFPAALITILPRAFGQRE